MKTLYFETNQYVRRQGNVIDLNEYRERMQRAEHARNAVGDDVTYHWETDESVWHYEERRRAPAKPKANAKTKTRARRLAHGAAQRRREAQAHERNVRTGAKRAAARTEQKAKPPSEGETPSAPRQTRGPSAPGKRPRAPRGGKPDRDERRRTAAKAAARTRYAHSRPVKHGKGSAGKEKQ